MTLALALVINLLFKLRVKMASEVKQSNASQYSKLSSVQYKAGCSFVDTFDLKLGDKVLDMAAVQGN
mgnify:CR=1 FL=1